MTFLGLADVEARHGSASAQLAASKQALLQALQWAVAQLDGTFHGDITYQVRAPWGLSRRSFTVPRTKVSPLL